MFILSNKKLLVALTMVACFSSVANAEQEARRKLRGSSGIPEEIQEVIEVDGRILKKKKKKNGTKKATTMSLTGNFGFVSNANNFGNTVARPVGHVQMFEDKCTSTPKSEFYRVKHSLFSGPGKEIPFFLTLSFCLQNYHYFYDCYSSLCPRRLRFQQLWKCPSLQAMSHLETNPQSCGCQQQNSFLLQCSHPRILYSCLRRRGIPIFRMRNWTARPRS